MKKFLLPLMLAAATVFASSEKSGVISKSEHWTLNGSPYIISDDLLIGPDATVRIDAGVHVLAGRPAVYRKDVPQLDAGDSFAVSIRVKGTLKCEGKPGNPVVFGSNIDDSETCTWYGLILDAPADQAQFAFTEIVNACTGITVVRGRPDIHNTVISGCANGIRVLDKTAPVVANCILTKNESGGLSVTNANPVVRNSIIAFNSNCGILSDGKSLIDMRYNCVWNNGDKSFGGCDPRLGVPSKKIDNKIPADSYDNIIADPIFAGSTADSLAVEKDVSLATDKSRAKNPELLSILHMGKSGDSLAWKKRNAKYKRWVLSCYSPCIGSGDPAHEYANGDGSRADMGIYGGIVSDDKKAGAAKSPQSPVEPSEPKSTESPKAPLEPKGAVSR